MNNTQLINQFKTYLEAQPHHQDEPGEQVDLFRLFTELSGIKNEVKRESRQVKEALDQFRQVFTLLENNQNELRSDLNNERREKKQAIDESLKSLLLLLLDIRDRLEASLKSITAYRSTTSSWFGQHEFIEHLAQGQQMTLRRLDQLLSSYQVQVMNVVKKPLDPHSMQVAEVVHEGSQKTGIVLREQRKGFTYQGNILRLAEVVVNK